MNQIFLSKFFFSIFLFSLLSSCSKSSYWSSSSIIGENKKFSGSNLVYQKPGNLLQLELLKIDDEISCFLNISTTEFSSSNKNISIDLITKTTSLSSLGYLRKGNQKIFLNEEATNFIIEALNKNEAITIKIEDMEETIDSQAFKKKFKKLLESNSFYTKLIRSLY